MSVPLPHNRRAYAAWIAVCVLWGTTYLGIRIALETIPPALVGGLRFTAAGMLLFGLLASRGEAVFRRSDWVALAIAGTLTICVGNGGVIWAEQWVPSGIAAVTVATIPFWMIGFEAFARGGDPLTLRLVAGLVPPSAGHVMLESLRKDRRVVNIWQESWLSKSRAWGGHSGRHWRADSPVNGTSCSRQRCRCLLAGW